MSGFSGNRILSPQMLSDKKPSEAGQSDCSINFFIQKFWFLYYKEILTEMFALLVKMNKFSIDCSPSFKLNKIRFPPSL